MVSEGRSDSLTTGRSSREVVTALNESVQVHRSRIGESRARALLFVLHLSPFSRDGGTEFHLRDLLEALSLERVVVAYPAGRELVAAEVFQGNLKNPVFYRFALSKPPDLVCIDNSEITSLVKHWIELFGISGCHIHHLSSWPISLGRVLAELQIPYLYTSHDYYAVCPNWNLFDYDLGGTCECKWEQRLGAGCLHAFTKAVGRVSAMEPTALRYAHRQAFREFISNAAAMVFPSEAARRRVLEKLTVEPGRAHVVEHGNDIRLHAPRLQSGANFRVAAVGGVAGPRKGNHNYSELVLKTADLPVEWHFFGADELPGLRNKHLDRRKVRFHGRYRRDQIADLLARQGIDLCVILPSVDETFSYVLSEVWAAGVPVLVNEKGSLPERVNKHGAGVVVEDVDQAFEWIERFCRNRADIQPFAERASAVRLTTNAENAKVYLQLYRTLNVLAPNMERESLEERVLQELVARRAAIDPGLPAPEASPEYQSSRWYPKFLSIKQYIPAPARQLGRKMLVIGEQIKRNRTRIVVGYHHRLRNLQVLNRAPRTVAFESTSQTPQIVLEVKPFRPEMVQEIQFELRHQSKSQLITRLLWTHSFDESFTVDKSVTVALENDRRWHRYSIKIDGVLKAKWEDGAEIVRLRFDPVNEPLRFELKPLLLGNFPLLF